MGPSPAAGTADDEPHVNSHVSLQRLMLQATHKNQQANEHRLIIVEVALSQAAHISAAHIDLFVMRWSVGNALVRTSECHLSQIDTTVSTMSPISVQYLTIVAYHQMVVM